ncbi:MAG: acyl-CoA dehydrogenase family protein [Longimicrobiales bacterium]
MADRSFLDWPFFDERHRRLAVEVENWAALHLGPVSHVARSSPRNVPGECIALVRALGDAGFLRHAVADPEIEESRLDVRSLCLIRETLAYHSGLADFAFAMQGLGSGPVSLFGSDALRREWLPRIAAGQSVAAFAISERDAGSDIAAIQASARRDGESWILDGEKTWISNAGIAGDYVIFCRTPELGERAFGAFLVSAESMGLVSTADLEISSPHVLGSLRLERCRVPAERMIGAPGMGLRVALATLDVFRPTVGAAALGFARRAMDEAVRRVRDRHVFGQPLAEHQLTRARIADMAVDVDASALFVYRAAWAHDTAGGRTTREAAMAKLFATEAAQRVIDSAVQLFGGRGVLQGEAVEALYREIRALRIYEGTSEIQQLVIAGQILPKV